jgi:hypothetical protein
MDITRFSLPPIIAVLFLATTGCGGGPEEPAVLYGDEYIPVEIRKYEPPLRLKNLERQGQREEPGWLKAERIASRIWAHSFDEVAAVYSTDSRINQIENARKKFEQVQAKHGERLQKSSGRYTVINEVVQTLHYTFDGKEMMTFSLMRVEQTDKTTGKVQKNTGRTLKLYTREGGRWKKASQQQAGPHSALFRKPEVQSEFLSDDPEKLSEGPLSWNRRKLIAQALPFQDRLEVSLAFENISGKEVELTLQVPESERVLDADVSPSTLAAENPGSLDVTFDTSSQINETFNFILEANGNKQEAAIFVYAQNDLAFSPSGKPRHTTKLDATPLRIHSSIVLDSANIEVVEKPRGLSVELTPDDSGFIWDIDLQAVGEETTGKVRFRLNSGNERADAVLIVED